MRSDPRIVLMIDGDHEALTLYASGLRARGFQPVTAATAEKGVTLAGTCHPAVIVTDLTTAARANFALIYQLRQDIRIKDVPILVLTGLTVPAVRQHAREAGCDRFLLKTYAPE